MKKNKREIIRNYCTVILMWTFTYLSSINKRLFSLHIYKHEDFCKMLLKGLTEAKNLYKIIFIIISTTETFGVYSFYPTACSTYKEIVDIL